MFSLSAFINATPGAVAQGLIWGIMAIGVYITFRTLDYADLSVDGSLGTGGAVAVMLIMGGVNPYIAMLCALISGMLAGLVTGIFHAIFGIPAILSGILTQLGLYSLNMAIMNDRSNQAITTWDETIKPILSSRYISWAILVVGIFCVVIIAVMYWFFGTELGHSIRATGCNQNMARAQGINTNSMKILGLVLSNGLVALSGGLYAQYQGNADVNMGRGAIVIGLAAVIIGEVVFGRIFKNFALRLLAVVFGAILYFIVQTLVLQLGLPSNYLKLFSALIVAIFLAIPYIRKHYFANLGRRKTKGVVERA